VRERSALAVAVGERRQPVPEADRDLAAQAMRAVAIACGSTSFWRFSAGNIGFARQLQDLGAECRLDRLVLGDFAEGIDQRPGRSRGGAFPCRRASRDQCVRLASICAACQRLNGSASKRS